MIIVLGALAGVFCIGLPCESAASFYTGQGAAKPFRAFEDDWGASISHGRISPWARPGRCALSIWTRQGTRYGTPPEFSFLQPDAVADALGGVSGVA